MHQLSGCPAGDRCESQKEKLVVLGPGCNLFRGCISSVPSFLSDVSVASETSRSFFFVSFMSQAHKQSSIIRLHIIVDFFMT